MRKRWWIGMLVGGLQAHAAVAVEVRFEPVAENVYVHVGDIGARSVSNEGLNANIGLVILDLMLQGLGGLETLRTVRLGSRHVAVV